VRSIPLAAVDEVHRGTGTHVYTKLLVKPESVAGSAPLTFVSQQVKVTTMLYELEAPVVPNWIGVAVPDGITDFSRPILYFHPSPAGAGYVDGVNNVVYFGKSKDDAVRTIDETRWRHLFAYVERLGGQLAGAVHFNGSPDQVVVFPFMASSALGTTGILPDHWKPTLSDILADVRATITGVAQPLSITDLVVAGYSYGCEVADRFRSRAPAPTLSPLLKQVWDFDGFPVPTSTAIRTVPGRYKAVKYSEGARPESTALPLGRWINGLPPTLPGELPALPPRNDVHHLIRDFMFLHACWSRG